MKSFMTATFLAEMRGAAALDATLAYDGRGPKTCLARRAVAEALDKGKRPKLADVKWLERVARRGGK